MCRMATAYVFVAVFSSVLGGCTQPRREAGLSFDARLRLAELADGQGNGDAVFTVMRDAYLRTPTDPAIRDQLLAVAAQSGHQSEAAEALRRGMQNSGRTTDGMLALCKADLHATNFKAAEEACRKVLELEPTNIAGIGLLGVVQDSLGDHAAAQQSYRSGLAFAPRDWSLLNNYGLSLLLSGRAAEAVVVLEPAESAAAAPRRMRHNLALALALTQQRERLLRLIRLDGQAADAEAVAEQFFRFAKDMEAQPRTVPDDFIAAPQGRQVLRNP
jgi:Flp pilus assembly protein TadD